MTKEELEKGFDDAAYQWLKKHGSMETRMARYFFFAGATFGAQTVTGIMKERREKITDEEATMPSV